MKCCEAVPASSLCFTGVDKMKHEPEKCERHELTLVDLITLKHVSLSTLFKYFNNYLKHF